MDQVNVHSDEETCKTAAVCREYLSSCQLNVIGFHVFAGSQVLDAEKVIDHLSRALELSRRAADMLAIAPRLVILGGGFGIPYGPEDEELDMAGVGDGLARLVERARPARLQPELGRYLVAEAGWYLTSVVGQQTYNGRRAVVVDGGVHQRSDLCGLRLRSKANPPFALDARSSPLTPTDVLGCLSLPDDILIEQAPLPSLAPRNVLAFGNAGAYGLWSSPPLFHGNPLPAEVAFDDTTIHLMRQRPAAQSILENQHHIIQKDEAVHA